MYRWFRSVGLTPLAVAGLLIASAACSSNDSTTKTQPDAVADGGADSGAASDGAAGSDVAADSVGADADATSDGADATSDAADAALDAADAAFDAEDAAFDAEDAAFDAEDAALDAADAAFDAEDAALDAADAALDAEDAALDAEDAALDAGDAASDVGDAAANDADATVDTDSTSGTDAAVGDSDASTTTTVTDQILAQGGTVFVQPGDAAPDALGQTVFFTALAASGTETAQAGIFSVSTAGSGAVTEVLVGAPLVAPVGVAVAADGSLFVADSTGGGGGKGVIFHVLGGVASTVIGTAGSAPTALTIQGATLYFVGIPAEGTATLWSVPVDGSAVPTAVQVGLPLSKPAGVAVAPNGDVYVADTNQILRISGGAVTMLPGTFQFGTPAGLAVTLDGQALLVSVLTGGHSAVLRLDLASQTTTPFVPEFMTLTQPGGLHRAASASVYAWVDASEGGKGAVHLFKK